MDDLDKKLFHPRGSGRHNLPRVSVERLKERVLAADQFKSRRPAETRQCECCGWRPPAPLLIRNKRLSLLHAHHVIAVSRGGNDAPENLILLCANCHGVADYLGGRIALIDPIRTREQLLDHLQLLLTDPDGWEVRETERERVAMSECTAALSALHD